MPFRQGIIKSSYIQIALQAQNHPKNEYPTLIKSTTPGGRVFFFISPGKGPKASITVEAAWLSVLFLTVVTALFSFFEMFYLENRLQAVMERLGTQAVMFGTLTEQLPEEFTAEGEAYQVLGELLFSGVSGFVLEEQLEKELEDLLPGAFCRAEHFQVDGLSLYGEDSIMDLIVRYEIRFPLFGKQTRLLRCRKRLWTGNRPPEKEGETVYITMTGSVYHLYEDCTHLKLSIRKASAGQLETLRNEGGGKYLPCELCIGQEELPAWGYVTSEGTRYHKEQTCSSLKRSVLAVDLSQVGDRPLCSRCRGREEAS